MTERGESEVLTAALRYAARGWPVFPCSPANKRPLLKSAVKGEGGLHLASLDEAQIRAWWKRWPQAMIGVPTGARSGMIAVDLDPRDHPADAMLAALRSWACGASALPPCPVSRTQSGGLHLLFAMPDSLDAFGAPLGNRANLFGKVEAAGDAIRAHVDVRGEGGYIVVPPSRMANGNEYIWESAPDIGDALPELPERLRKLILREGGFGDGDAAHPPRNRDAISTLPSREGGKEEDAGDEAVRRYAQAALINACRRAETAPAGARNQALNDEALGLGHIVAAGALSEGMVRALLEQAAGASGLTRADGIEATRATIDSGLRAGLLRPHDFSEIRAKAEARARRGSPANRGARASARPHEGSSSGPSSSSAPPPPTGDEGAATDPRGGEDEFDGEGLEGGSHEGSQGAEASSGGAGGRGSVRLGRPDDGWGEGRFEHCAAQPQNDTGNGKRLLAHHGENLLWVREVGPHWWAGTHWEVTGGKEASLRAAQATAAAIALEADWMTFYPFEERVLKDAEAIGLKAEDERGEDEKAVLKRAADIRAALENRQKTRRKFAVASGNSSKINGMLTQAEPWRTADPSEMDADPMAVACMNGTLRIRKIEDVEHANADEPRYTMKLAFNPPRREDMMTKFLPAAYEPGAACPKFEAFLERFQPDPVMRKFLQTWCGYSLTGLTDEQALLYHFGTGANGKSTFTEAIMRLFGPYAQNLNPESISGTGQRRGDQATPEIAQLPGKRVVIVAELPAGEQVKESLIKALTGGDKQQARHLNKGFFDFYPTFKGQMSGNTLPTIYGTDYGIWRRLRIVPWLVKIEDHEKRKMAEVLAEFAAEHSGMLNWLLKGLETYLTEGLAVPEAVTSLTAEYRDEVDVIGRFVGGCLVRLETVPDDPGHGLAAGELYKVFVAWCEANGVKPKTMTRFGTEMNAKGIAKVERGGRRFYVGVELSPDAPKPVQDGDNSLFKKDDPPYGSHRGG